MWAKNSNVIIYAQRINSIAQCVGLKMSFLEQFLIFIIHGAYLYSMCPEIIINLSPLWPINFSNDSIVFCLQNASHQSRQFILQVLMKYSYANV